MYGLMCQCVIRVSCYKNHHGTLNLTFEALSYRCCRCRLVCALDVSVCTQLHRRGQAVELHRPARCDVSSAPCAGGLSTCFTSPQQAPRRWPCGHHANPDFCLRYPFTVPSPLPPPSPKAPPMPFCHRRPRLSQPRSRGTCIVWSIGVWGCGLWPCGRVVCLQGS